MDIEGSEWSSFRSLPVSYLEYIDQIVIEIHLSETFSYYEGNIDIVNNLIEQFYPVNLHMNNFNCWKKQTSLLPSKVFELTLVNKNLLKVYSKTRSYSPN